MMNGITLDNQTPQVAFRARKINDIKIAQRVVDQINDAAVEFLHKDRPIEEKRETMLKRYTAKFMEVFGKRTNKNNKLVETTNKASKEANLEILKETDPELYKEVIKRQKEEIVMDAYNKAYENFVLKRMMKEDPEKAKIIMRNRIIAATKEQISKMLSPKNLIKMYWNYLTTETAIGLGKLLGKCDRTVNKILPKTKLNFVQKMSDKINTMKEYRQYKKYIMQTVKNGERTREQAEVLLQNKWVALHYKPEQNNNTLIEVTEDAQRLSK